MKYLLLFLFSLQILLASVNQTEELSVFDNVNEKKEIITNDSQEKIEDTGVLEEENITVTNISADEIDYYKEIIINTLDYTASKNLYLSYLSQPKFVYQKQTFELVIKVIVAKDEYDSIDVRFVDSRDIKVLNPDSNWSDTQNQIYQNKFYFKASSSTFIMPKIQIILYNNDEIVDIEYLEKADIKFAKLASGNKRFSNVIASELKVTNYKTKQYNNKELLTVLEIYSLNGNLEDFKLSSDFEEQDVTSFEQSYPLQNLVYHAVIPIHTKNISFNYYNTLENKFITINLPILLKNDLVSTQTDLNPNNSSFEFYKKVAIAVLAFISLLITLWKRKLIYLIVTLIIFIILIIFIMPHKTKIIQKDVIIYILPTKNSTVFYKTKKEQLVQILNKRAGFYKVLFNINDNEVIGWIKEKNVKKN